MESSHPLGDDFARWVELTDDYETQIAHAFADDTPSLRGLSRLAERLRAYSRASGLFRSVEPLH